MLSGCNIGCEPDVNSDYSVASQTNCHKDTAKKSSPKKKARETNDKESCYSFIGDSLRTNGKKECNSMCTKAVISHPAPNFEGLAVVNGEFTRLELAHYLGKYLVLFFYPLDFTFVCPTEIVAFSQRVQEFRNINTEVIGCSVDSHFCHLAWTQTPRGDGGVGKVNIPLLSDNTHKISKDYGIYMEEWGHSLRAHFIIDHRGILRQITINDLPVGRSVDETLRLVNAFQFTDSYGEVCPIDWNKGDKGIVPNQEGKKEYFQKKY